MARSGQDARRPPSASTPEGSSGPAPQPRTPGFDNRMAVWLIGLGMARHALRNHRFYETVALAVIVLRALRGIGQENRASAMARLAAWNKREIQRLEHKTEQQGRAVKSAGHMVRSRPSKDLAQKMHET